MLLPRISMVLALTCSKALLQCHLLQEVFPAFFLSIALATF